MRSATRIFVPNALILSGCGAFDSQTKHCPAEILYIKHNHMDLGVCGWNRSFACSIRCTPFKRCLFYNANPSRRCTHNWARMSRRMAKWKNDCVGCIQKSPTSKSGAELMVCVILNQCIVIPFVVVLFRMRGGCLNLNPTQLHQC